MWRPEPPGCRWLLAHEMRLGWRAIGGVRSRIVAAVGILVVLLGHFAAAAFVASFDAERVLRMAPVPMIALTVFFGLLIVSAAFGLAAQALFSRGDFDLLLASPVPVTHVYAVRGVAVALGSIASLAILFVPLANVGPFVGKWGTLAAYPVMLSIGLASAALALAATMALVRVAGVRRARVLAQVLGALVGAALLIVVQLESLLPRSWRGIAAEWARHDWIGWWLSADSPLAWPLRAAVGEPLPALAVIATGVGLYVLVIRTTSGIFAASAQTAPQAPARRAASSPSATRFRGGLARVVIAKELTLIARDPALIGRSLLQVLYLVPLFIILVRKAHAPTLIAAAVIMISASLASSLAWMTMSGEESPDLVGSAPVPYERVRWLKVAAALIPVALLLAPFVAWYALHSPDSLPVVLACLAAAVASSAVVQVWTARPGSGRDIRVHYRSNVVVNLAEQLSAFGWALVCYLALAASGALWALPLGLLAPVVAWLWGRKQRN